MVLWLKKHGILNRANTRGAAITVDDLANNKKLPADFLASLGLKNIAEGVRVPYFLIDGSPALRHRVRTALMAKSGSRWDARDGAVEPYGASKLPEAEAVGFLVIVEGESDAWTLWYHGYPALGVPGAQMAKCLRQEHVASIPKVFVMREPDTGGAPSFAASGEIKEVGYGENSLRFP